MIFLTAKVLVVMAMKLYSKLVMTEMDASLEHTWQGFSVTIADPAAVFNRLQGDPGGVYSLYRDNHLCPPIDSARVTAALSPSQPERGRAYSYQTDITLDHAPVYMNRYMRMLRDADRQKKYGGFMLSRASSGSPFTLFVRDPGILSAYMYPDNETGNVALRGHSLPGRYETQPTIVQSDDEAQHQLLSFIRMSNLAMAMCATLGHRRHFMPWGSAFPPRRLERQYTVDSDSLIRIDSLGSDTTARVVEPATPPAEVAKPEIRQTKELDVTIGYVAEPESSLEQLDLPPVVEHEVNTVIALFGQDAVTKSWAVSSPRRVFLYGPPGGGKTSVAHAIANGIGGVVWKIGPEHVFGKWLGESEQRMAKVFKELADISSPTVLLLDEFQGFIKVGREDKDTSRDISAVRSIIRRGLEHEAVKNPNVIIVAASNLDPNSELDESLVRAGRFDIRLHLAHPDQNGRSRIFTKAVAGLLNELADGAEPAITVDSESIDTIAIGSGADSVIDLNDFDPAALARESDAMSGAEIHAIIQSALREKAHEQMRTGTRPGPLTQADLLTAVARHKKIR